MHNIFIVLTTVFTSVLFTACASTDKNKTESTPKILWKTVDTNYIQAPESAYFEPNTGFLYVSNVVGQADKKDGQGWISQLDVKTGKILQGKWVSGLNAPKGLRSKGDVLWVTDIDRVVSFNLKTKKQVMSIKIPGAKFLNDIAIDTNGSVFVSDMMTGKIHQIIGKNVRTFLSGDITELPNGLLIHKNSPTSDDRLVVAGWGVGIKADFTTSVLGNLYALDTKSKEKSTLTAAPMGNFDGLEFDSESNSFLVSDWISGKIFSIHADQKSSLILNDGQGTADIGWVQPTRVLIVPQMVKGKITAYQL